MIDETVYNSFMSAIPKDPVDAIIHVDEMRETLMGSTEDQARSPLKPFTAEEILQIKESYDALTPEEKELFPTLDDFIAYIQKTREESVPGGRKTVRNSINDEVNGLRKLYKTDPEKTVENIVSLMQRLSKDEVDQHMEIVRQIPDLYRAVTERMRKVEIPQGTSSKRKSVFDMSAAGIPD